MNTQTRQFHIVWNGTRTEGYITHDAGNAYAIIHAEVGDANSIESTAARAFYDTYTNFDAEEHPFDLQLVNL